MDRATPALLPNSNSRPTIIRSQAVAVAKGSEAANSSAMAINVTPASATTTVTTDDAAAINSDVADSVRRADHVEEAAGEAVVVAAAAAAA